MVEKVRLVKGCLILGLVPFAALLILFSLGSTWEIEHPEVFPGLRSNGIDSALIYLVFGVTAALGTLVLAAKTSRILLVVVGLTVCGLLLPAATYRAYTLAPMLKCWKHNTIAHEDDGSYTCYDR